MTLKIMTPKVQSKEICSTLGELERGYRLAAVKQDREDNGNHLDMLSKLKRLAHAKDSSSQSVNRTNQESVSISARKLSHAIAVMNIREQIEVAMKDSPLLSTVKLASNVLKFKPST